MGDNKKTIAYLLGAGASANCLPIVNNMAKGIQIVIDELNKAIVDNPMIRVSLTGIFSSLVELREICEENYSVDTYAKKLYISGQSKKYHRLKDSLTLFFSLQQKLKRLDNRYDNFWAAILSSRANFPDNLRVLSWNYDSQIEQSYMDFALTKELSQAYVKLNMVSMHSDLYSFIGNKFSIVKLNGSAKYKRESYTSGEFSYLVNDFSHDNLGDDFFDELSEKFGDISLFDDVHKKRANVSELSFAWEHRLDSEFHIRLKESLKDVTVLAVIGYSFPIYNRKIDKLIINDYMPNLDKVYIQAPDAVDIKDRFLAITDRISSIVLNGDTGQFIFPNELDI